MTEDLLASLRQLKENGEKAWKPFKEPVNNFLNLNDEWLFGYCIEDCGLWGQKSLSISRIDKHEFEKMPGPIVNSLVEIFGQAISAFSDYFAGRGFTHIYVVGKIEREVEAGSYGDD